MRILFARCPEIRIRLILDGTGALVDPAGADRKELGRIMLKEDIDRFESVLPVPGRVSSSHRNVRKTEGLKEFYLKDRPDGGGREGVVAHRGRLLPGVRRSDLYRPGGSGDPRREAGRRRWTAATGAGSSRRKAIPPCA